MWPICLQCDSNRDLITTLCAIDAISYRNHELDQYEDNAFLRDLNKSFVGFSAPCLKQNDWTKSEDHHSEREYQRQRLDDICNDSDDEYLTASDEETVLSCTQNLSILTKGK